MFLTAKTKLFTAAELMFLKTAAFANCFKLVVSRVDTLVLFLYSSFLCLPHLITFYMVSAFISELRPVAPKAVYKKKVKDHLANHNL